MAAKPVSPRRSQCSVQAARTVAKATARSPLRSAAGPSQVTACPTGGHWAEPNTEAKDSHMVLNEGNQDALNR